MEINCEYENSGYCILSGDGILDLCCDAETYKCDAETVDDCNYYAEE